MRISMYTRYFERSITTWRCPWSATCGGHNRGFGCQRVFADGALTCLLSAPPDNCARIRELLWTGRYIIYSSMCRDSSNFILPRQVFLPFYMPSNIFMRQNSQVANPTSLWGGKWFVFHFYWAPRRKNPFQTLEIILSLKICREHSATYYNLRTRKEKNRPTCTCSPYPPCDDRHRSTRDWSVRLVIRVTARHICPPLTISGTAVRGQLIIKSLACNSHTVSDIFICDTMSVQLAHLTEGLYVNRNAAGTTCI